jgi:hypothetical protein
MPGIRHQTVTIMDRARRDRSRSDFCVRSEHWCRAVTRSGGLLPPWPSPAAVHARDFTPLKLAEQLRKSGIKPAQ